MLSFELINLHRCWPHEQNTFYTYNHGQTSWNTFAFVVLSLYHTWPTSPPPPRTKNKVGSVYPEFFPLYIARGEGEQQDVSERLHCFMTAPANYRKSQVLHYCPKDVFPGFVDSATAESFMSENSCYIFFSFSSSFFYHQNSALRECSLTIVGSQCDWGCESES